MKRRFRVIPRGPYIAGFRHENDVTDFDVTTFNREPLRCVSVDNPESDFYLAEEAWLAIGGPDEILVTVEAVKSDPPTTALA